MTLTERWTSGRGFVRAPSNV